MMVKHTPGPLHVEDGAGRWDDDGDWDSVVVVPVDGDEMIAELFYKTGDADAEANTRADAALFAAAPALADALEKAADTLRDASAAYHFFGKHVAAEAMDIAEKHCREVLRAAGRLP